MTDLPPRSEFSITRLDGFVPRGRTPKYDQAFATMI